MSFQQATYFSPRTSRLIGTVHLALGVMALVFYLAGTFAAEGASLFTVTLIWILIFLGSALLQRQMRLTSPRSVWFFAAFDLLLFHGLIWSLAGLHGGVGAAALQAQAYIFVFVLLALQALRGSPALILFLGAFSFAARLVILLVLVSGGAPTTLSYLTALSSPSILLGAEGQILLALVFFSLFLATALKLNDSHRSEDEMEDDAASDVDDVLIEISDTLPEVNDSEPDSERAAQEGVPAYSGEVQRPVRVLIAEDNQVNMMVLEKQLTSPAFELIMTEDGEEAVEVFTRMLREERRPPDVCLLDIEMPGLSGREVARRIRQLELLHRQHRRPIIAVTALAGPEQVRLSMESGMDDHLVKPVSREQLLTSLALALNSTIRAA